MTGWLVSSVVECLHGQQRAWLQFFTCSNCLMTLLFVLTFKTVEKNTFKLLALMLLYSEGGLKILYYEGGL